MSEQCTERRALNVVAERCTNGKLRDCETAGPLSPFSAFLTRKETIFFKTSLKIYFYRKILVQQTAVKTRLATQTERHKIHCNLRTNKRSC